MVLHNNPRVPSVQQYGTFVEPNVPQQPMAATTPDELKFFFSLCMLFLILWIIFLSGTFIY